MDLHKKLRAARDERGLSQSEIAEAMGWPDNSYVSRVENGMTKQRAVELAFWYIREHGFDRSYFFVDDIPARLDGIEDQITEIREVMEEILRRINNPSTQDQ